MTIDELSNQFQKLAQLVRRHIHDGIETERLPSTSVTDSSISSSVSSSPSSGSPSLGSGWELIDHTTADASFIAVIAGLDLNTDLQYHFVIQIRNITNGGIIQARCNNDSTAGRHGWALQGYHNSGVESHTGNDLDTEWPLNHPSGNESHHISLYLARNTGVVLANWTCASVGYSGDATRNISTAQGAGFWNSNDNVTSISFTHNSGSQTKFEIWTFTATT